MKMSPCKGCTERSVHCHSECEKYKEYAAQRREYLDGNRVMNAGGSIDTALYLQDRRRQTKIRNQKKKKKYIW